MSLFRYTHIAVHTNYPGFAGTMYHFLSCVYIFWTILSSQLSLPPTSSVKTSMLSATTQYLLKFCVYQEEGDSPVTEYLVLQMLLGLKGKVITKELLKLLFQVLVNNNGSCLRLQDIKKFLHTIKM